MRSQKIKIWAAVLTITLLLTTGIGVVYAYLSATASSSNNLGPAIVATPEVEVSTSVNTQNQKRTATGMLTVDADNCPLYVRVAVVINWINTEGEVCSPPEGATSDITLPDKWGEVGPFYYYTEVIDAEENLTAAFVVEYTAPDAYEVQVEIISQTIQALGTTGSGIPAVTDAWGVEVDADGKLIINPIP